MTRARSYLLAIACAVVLLSTRASAISPAYLLVYGGTLPAPSVVAIRAADRTDFLWDAISRGGARLRGDTVLHGTIPAGLEQRRYISVAIFWGMPTAQSVMKPENASQHARIYLPTTSEPAVVVATTPDMSGMPAPVPAQPDGFVAGWTVTPAELDALRAMGVPGLS
jgi:hypothetical protein